MTASRDLKESFFVIRMVQDRESKTTFVLDHSKVQKGVTGSYDRIVFRFNFRPELKSLLLHCFQTDRAFDFHIDEDFADRRAGECSIDSIDLPVLG